MNFVVEYTDNRTIKSSPLISLLLGEHEILHYRSMLFISLIISLVDAHAPLRTCRVPVHSLVPWYRQDIREAKRLRQCRERTWWQSGLVVHHQIYWALCTAIHNLIRSAKSDFYTSELWKCEGNQ